jgi:hypothetical protein
LTGISTHTPLEKGQSLVFLVHFLLSTIGGRRPFANCMQTVVIKFQTILDLMDFASVIAHDGHEIDHSSLTIRGQFEDADVELAHAGYKAAIITG